MQRPPPWTALVTLATLATLMLEPVPVASAAGLPLTKVDAGWNVECKYDHSLPDDPIVYPNQPGAGHLHDFFGNVTTNAYSTWSSLSAGSTRCLATKDHAAYWAPALYLADATKVLPILMHAYYRVGSTTNPEDFQPYPAGLKIVSGDASATTSQPISLTYWTCEHVPAAPHLSTPFDCTPYAADVAVHVRFPNCWDGKNLDSSDHRSHMALADQTSGVCPVGYPVHVPQLGEVFVYGVENASGATLSSGGQYSAHGAFFNAWDQSTIQALVATCLNVNRACGSITD